MNSNLWDPGHPREPRCQHNIVRLVKDTTQIVIWFGRNFTTIKFSKMREGNQRKFPYHVPLN